MFGNQNNFATFLTLALPYFLVIPLLFHGATAAAHRAIGTLADLMALLLTGSKDNLIAAALVFLTVIFFLATDPAQRAKLLGAVAIVAVALVVIVPSLSGSGLIPLPKRAVDKFSFTLLQQEISTGQGSGAARASLLTDGIDFIGQSGASGSAPATRSPMSSTCPVFPGVSTCTTGGSRWRSTLA